MSPSEPQPAFEVESSLLINEGGVQCRAVVFARPLAAVETDDLAEGSLLGGVPIAGLDPARAAQRGAGLVAFVLEDPMDARRFLAGDVVRLSAAPRSGGAR